MDSTPIEPNTVQLKVPKGLDHVGRQLADLYGIPYDQYIENICWASLIEDARVNGILIESDLPIHQNLKLGPYWAKTQKLLERSNARYEQWVKREIHEI